MVVFYRGHIERIHPGRSRTQDAFRVERKVVTNMSSSHAEYLPREVNSAASRSSQPGEQAQIHLFPSHPHPIPIPTPSPSPFPSSLHIHSIPCPCLFPPHLSPLPSRTISAQPISLYPLPSRPLPSHPVPSPPIRPYPLPHRLSSASPIPTHLTSAHPRPIPDPSPSHPDPS